MQIFYTLLAHAGENHDLAQDTEQSADILTTIGHWPTLFSLLACAVMLFAIYGLLTTFRVKPLNRLLCLIPAVIALSIFYMSHNAAVTTVLLSAGFIATFLLVFTMLSKPSQ